VRVHARVLWLQLYELVPHPVSKTRLPVLPTANAVPPTAVTQGLDAGQSGVA
jgi:hypothetical protein